MTFVWRPDRAGRLREIERLTLWRGAWQTCAGQSSGKKAVSPDLAPTSGVPPVPVEALEDG